MIYKIKNHRVKCGNINEGIHDLMDGQKANIVYTDPPWGEGNIKYWQTINNKQTGKYDDSLLEIDDFYSVFFELIIKHTTNNAIIFIENGIRWCNYIVNFAIDKKLFHLATIECLYGSKPYVNHLHIFSKIQLEMDKLYLNNIHHKSGLELLRNAISPFAKQGDNLLDVCCGLGTSAKISLEFGMNFYGNEINSKRLEKTISILNKKTPT